MARVIDMRADLTTYRIVGIDRDGQPMDIYLDRIPCVIGCGVKGGLLYEFVSGNSIDWEEIAAINEGRGVIYGTAIVYDFNRGIWGAYDKQKDE